MSYQAISKVTKQAGSPKAYEQVAEIPIDSQALESMCRRGHRRLRDIESSSQTTLKIHRFRGVLEVHGSQSAIDDVCRQLDCLTGPRVPVTIPVWAELMRTRTNPSPARAALARIQQQSDCRVHIERTHREVRLFGPDHKTAIAQQLLDELERMCIQEKIYVESPLSLDQQVVRDFADDYCVTLLVEPTQIVVLGIKDAVLAAAQDLQRYQSGVVQADIHSEAANSSEFACFAVTEALSKLEADAAVGVKSPNALFPLIGDGASMPPKKSQGAVISTSPPAAPQRVATIQETQPPRSLRTSPTCEFARAKFCSNCGKPIAKALCGSANFCAYCGHAIARTEFPSTANAMNMVLPPEQVQQARGAQQLQHQVAVPMQTMVMPACMMAMCVPAGVSFQQAFVTNVGQHGVSIPAITDQRIDPGSRPELNVYECGMGA